MKCFFFPLKYDAEWFYYCCFETKKSLSNLFFFFLMWWSLFYTGVGAAAGGADGVRRPGRIPQSDGGLRCGPDAAHGHYQRPPGSTADPDVRWGGWFKVRGLSHCRAHSWLAKKDWKAIIKFASGEQNWPIIMLLSIFFFVKTMMVFFMMITQLFSSATYRFPFLA